MQVVEYLEFTDREEKADADINLLSWAKLVFTLSC